MRILKYLIFLSILCVIFSVIYRQSDKKGFRRWRTSFKTAIIFSAIAAGLIPVNPEAIEPLGNKNQVYQERLLSDQEFNSFENNDQKCILVKTGDSLPSVPTSPGRGQPSQFPTPPSGGRSSRPSTGFNPSSIYRPTPKVGDQGLGAGANPAGEGGGDGAAEFDDQCPAPKKQQQSQKSDRNEFQSNIYNSNEKKKPKAEQSELYENVTDGKIKIVSKIKEDAGLVRAAKEACKNADVQKDITHLEEELVKGNDNPGIGRKSIGNGIIEHRGKNGGRLYVRESDSGIEILAKSGKNKNNQQFVINRLKEIYG
jgi:hypothetical protein